jgi:hypothetical protein
MNKAIEFAVTFDQQEADPSPELSADWLASPRNSNRNLIRSRACRRRALYQPAIHPKPNHTSKYLQHARQAHHRHAQAWPRPRPLRRLRYVSALPTRKRSWKPTRTAKGGAIGCSDMAVNALRKANIWSIGLGTASGYFWWYGT